MNVKEKMMLSGIVIILSLVVGIVIGVVLWKKFGDVYKVKHSGRVELVNYFIAIPVMVCLFIGILIVIKIGEL